MACKTQPDCFSNGAQEEFIGAAASAFLADALISDSDRDVEISGIDLFPPACYAAAGMLWAEITAANSDRVGCGIYSIAQNIGAANGGTADFAEIGYYFAMAALGHGVSYFDDHAEPAPAVVIPYMENPLDPAEAWEWFGE